MLVMKNTTPKPPNRRIADRSVVARDSSWPDCQASWKPGSSRCRWAYRSSRIVFSMPATAPAWTQRRKKFRKDWSSPKATAATPSSTSRPG